MKSATTKMTTTLQLKLRGIFLTDDMPENLTNPVGDIFSIILSPLSNIFQYLISLLNQAFHILTNPIVQIFSSIISGVSNFFRYLIGFPNHVFRYLTNSIVEISKLVSNFIPYMISLFNKEFQNLINPIGHMFSKIFSTVSNLFPYLIALFKKEFQNITNFIDEIFSKTVTAVCNFFQNLTTPVGEIFSEVVSAVSSFFGYLIVLFNQTFPAESRDEQIRLLTKVVTPYLIGVVVLIPCFYFRSYIFNCISFILGRIFKAMCMLFKCIWSILVGVPVFFKWIFSCLRIGGTTGVKLMIAPGRPLVMISRAAFEANPLGYFRGLRGLPTDFVY